jgi:hypothetical protein
VAHARIEDLRDIVDVLDQIRLLPGVAERAPGVFYLRRVPFLHFHTKGSARWADAKIGSTWGAEISIPLGASGALKAAFVDEVRARYRACTEGLLRPSQARTSARRPGPAPGTRGQQVRPGRGRA